MANDTLLTPSIISKETLVILNNNLVMAGRVNRQFEDQMGAKIGTQLTIRKPNRFTVSNGPGLQLQDIVEPSTTITITNQNHVDFEFNSAALTLVVEEFSERYCKPAAEALGNIVDQTILQQIINIYNEVGTPGTVPNAFSYIALAAQRLDEEAAPQRDRTLVLNPAAYWKIANGISSVFVQSVAEPAFKGYLPPIANFEIYEDQNVPTQTTGLYGAGTTCVINGAGQAGSTLVTSGWPASVTGLLNVGDVFTIAGVNAINPQSRASTGSLRNFVVTSTVNSNSSGGASISIYPALTPSLGGTVNYSTVDVSPASGAAITVISGSSGQTLAKNIAFCKDTFGMVSVPLVMPDGVDFKAQEKFKGISLRTIRDWDINNDVFPCRLDIMFGTATYYPELGCRLTN